tara:strand:- start:110 stop:301 length:192 start_codon:yes stop_codon:yes gene_type:complete
MSSLKELKSVNKYLNKANENVDRLKDIRKNTILACLNKGHSIIEISNALELSRQRVYKIIERR